MSRLADEIQDAIDAWFASSMEVRQQPIGQFVAERITALSHTATSEVEPVADKTLEVVQLKEAVKEALEEGEGFWGSCSGCSDSGEFPSNPSSSIFKCGIGNGCSECGGIGAVWDTTDYEHMAREILADSTSPPTPTHDSGLAGELAGKVAELRKFLTPAKFTSSRQVDLIDKCLPAQVWSKGKRFCTLRESDNPQYASGAAELVALLMDNLDTVEDALQSNSDSELLREAISSVQRMIETFDIAGGALLDCLTQEERSSPPLKLWGRNEFEVLEWANDIAARSFREGMQKALARLEQGDEA